MTSVGVVEGENLVHSFADFSLEHQDRDQGHNQNQIGTLSAGEIQEMGGGSDYHGGTCAICLNKIVLQETALIKGCEHAYCVTCILQWATYRKEPTCPQCKHPFEFLNLHRSLDGSLHDYMFEESVCLLLRASWFKPLAVGDHKHEDDELFDYVNDQLLDYIYDYYRYEEEDDMDEEELDDMDDDEVYYRGSSSIRIGNRRWGDNGYVRAGRLEARPVYRPNREDEGAGSSRESRKKGVSKTTTGRRQKKEMKCEAVNKAAAAKHEKHLARLGRNK